MFLYDGWNLLVESDSVNSTQRSYVWGIDASGTMQGAGGVGGLLWTTAGSQTHAAGYDANGNIIAWVNASDGILSGTREYGAFGENIAATGVGVLDEWSGIPFGFSTKYQDRLTGHYYYGYRFYDTSSGRWLSRDPIEEEGGLNLYAFVGNNGVNQWDLLGMKRFSLRYDMASAANIGPFGPWGVVNLDRFSDILADIEKKIDGQYSETGDDPCNCIQKIVIGGHGGPGAFSGDDPSSDIYHFQFSMYNKLVDSGRSEQAKDAYPGVHFMSAVSKYMCKDGKIRLISCETCAGSQGEAFIDGMESIFGEGNFQGETQSVTWTMMGVWPSGGNKKK